MRTWVSPAAAVVSVAERFSLTTRVEDPVGPTGVQRYQYPTVLLVDPGVVATGAGEAQLRRIADAIPEWVTPVVLAGLVSKPASQWSTSAGCLQRTVSERLEHRVPMRFLQNGSSPTPAAVEQPWNLPTDEYLKIPVDTTRLMFLPSTLPRITSPSR